MTNELAVMLIGPVGALCTAMLLGAFIVYRVNRYGQVFNWSPFSSSENKNPRGRTDP